MLLYDFEDSIGYWLTATTHSFHRAVAEEIAPHGITYRQSQVLGWLAVEGELSQAELATKMMVEPPTLVGILDRMERDGWITRNSCVSDRRKKMIRPTEAVEPVWEKIAESARRVRARATDGLSEQELDTLKQLLDRVSRNLESQSSPMDRPVESLT